VAGKDTGRRRSDAGRGDERDSVTTQSVGIGSAAADLCLILGFERPAAVLEFSPALIQLLIERHERMEAKRAMLLLDVILGGVAPTQSKDGGKVYRKLRAALSAMSGQSDG